MKSVLKTLLIGAIISCSLSTFATHLNDITLDPLPSWVGDRIFKGDRRAFNVRLLAQKENLSLREALEVQNHFLDQVDTPQNQKSAEEKFQIALARVKSGTNVYESVWNQEKIDHAKFIVVFDLDDTLFSEYYSCGYKSEKFRDLKLQESCLNPKWNIGDKACGNCVKFSPGWKEIIDQVKSLGGAVVLFTAKRDSRAQRIFKLWMYDEKTPLSQVIDGFLTKNHLTFVPVEISKTTKGPKRAGQARDMKDLELIDPTLQRIILIDDSPKHSYQPQNVRAVQRFLPDSYFAKETDPRIKKMYENTFPEVAQEIKDSVDYMNKNNCSFVAAYRPYSLVGRYALYNLVDLGLSKTEAANLLRKHPDVIENRF